MIEALMAATLLVVGIFAVMGTTTTIMEKNENSRKSSIAMTLAQDKIEYYKGLGQAWLLAGAPKRVAAPEKIFDRVASCT